MLPPRALVHAAALLHETGLQKSQGRAARPEGTVAGPTISELPGTDDFEKISSVQLLVRHGLVELVPLAGSTKTGGLATGSNGRADAKNSKAEL
eukprot:SAG22_NODE_1490_length_4307_cov_6.140684_4_plen_94_part_00